MTEPYKDLTELPEEELIQRHDNATVHTTPTAIHYLEELRHRQSLKVLQGLARDISQATDLIAETSRSLGTIAAYCIEMWDLEYRTGRIKTPPPSLK